MCFGCWQEFGSPRLINERVLAAVPLVKRVYEFSCVGGNLHVHLDDWNLEDEFFDKFEVHHTDAPPAQLAAERECFDAFKVMTLDERAAALALERGYTLDS